MPWRDAGKSFAEKRHSHAQMNDAFTDQAKNSQRWPSCLALLCYDYITWPTRKPENWNIFTKKRFELLLVTESKLLKRLNQYQFLLVSLSSIYLLSLCLRGEEETLHNNTLNLSCKVCSVSLCCVPFTSKNSLQVKFSEVLNERTQTADHRTLQGGYTWQRAASWGDTDTQTWTSQRQEHKAMKHDEARWESEASVLPTMSRWSKYRVGDEKEVKTHLSPHCGNRTLWLCSSLRRTQTARSPSSPLALGHQPECWSTTARQLMF